MKLRLLKTIGNTPRWILYGLLVFAFMFGPWTSAQAKSPNNPSDFTTFHYPEKVVLNYKFSLKTSVKPLILCTFHLIQKYQKIKTKKSFPAPTSPAPRFFVGPRNFRN